MIEKINGEKGPSGEEQYFLSSSYFHFPATLIEGIKIEVTQTQGQDEEKHLTQLILTEEIGTFKGFPQINGRFESNLVRFKMINQKYRVYRGREVWGGQIVFRDYPREYATDIEMVYRLMQEDSFYIWPCGGRTGREYVSHPLRTFRLEDLFKVQIDQDLMEVFSKNIYTSNFNMSLSVVEVV
jgi:hypothetical protein